LAGGLIGTTSSTTSGTTTCCGCRRSRRSPEALGVSMDVLWYGEEEAERLAWHREREHDEGI
jgi:hypothetical protein